MDKFKTITHVIAVILVVASGFLATPAGSALVHQYPSIAPIAGLIAIAAVYFKGEK